MKPRIKFGLISGAIGLVLNVIVAALFGICGPMVSLLAGAAAGYFAAREEKPAAKGDGARAGAISGAIAGALVLIGQVLGAIGTLLFFQVSGMRVPFGTVPSVQSDPGMQAIYYVTGIGTGLCFGVVGLVLGALAGAGTGYMGTPDSAPAVPTAGN